MHDKKDSKCAVFATTLAHCTVHILWFMRSTIVRFWSYKLEHLIIFNSCSVHKCWFNPIFVHFLTLYFPPFIEWMQTHTGNRASVHTLFVPLFFLVPENEHLFLHSYSLNQNKFIFHRPFAPLPCPLKRKSMTRNIPKEWVFFSFSVTLFIVWLWF